MASRNKKPLPLGEAGRPRSASPRGAQARAELKPDRAQPQQKGAASTEGRSLNRRRPGEGLKTGDTPYPVVKLKSWEEYLASISDSPYLHWAFRGQRDASAPLFSALSRHFMAFRVDPRAWPEQEKRILRIFKRKAIHFLQHVPERDDDFQWLALMQDHGAPTRLLDFTWSPYVAAFFALHNTTHEGVIWACNPVEIKKHKAVDLEKPGSFREYFFSGAGTFVWLGEPHAMNRRLIAQSGTFLVPSVLDRSIEEILKEYPNPENTLIKFIVPAEKIREKGMRELYRMNITQATLFPDLDGLARSLAYELEFHWAYDPRTMKPMRK